jgi:acyl carrier protein
MNTLQELEQLVNTKYGIDSATLGPNSLLAEHGLDSLSLAELLFTIEDHFKVDIPDSRTDVNTLADLAALIDQLRAAQPA